MCGVVVVPVMAAIASGFMTTGPKRCLSGDTRGGELPTFPATICDGLSTLAFMSTTATSGKKLPACWFSQFYPGCGCQMGGCRTSGYIILRQMLFAAVVVDTPVKYLQNRNTLSSGNHSNEPV